MSEMMVFETQDFLMNTNVEQKIFSNAPDAIYKASLKKLIELENIMSFYIDASEVSLLNRNAGNNAVKLTCEMMSILEHAKTFSQLSDNAFNILLAPLVQLWRKSGAENKMPTQRDIQKAQELCGNDNLEINNGEQTAYLRMKGSMIDLGGIGKGFAADVCCDIYKDMGALSAYINLGGNVKTLGDRPDGKQWSVGLQHPDKPRGHFYGAIMCSDLSVVTSGAYERYQEINGARYHHIIDGRTGYPSESDLKSVTVLSSSSIQADAISTAAFVMGLEKGIDLIRDSGCDGAVFFTSRNEIYLTKGVKQYLRLSEKMTCYEA